MTQMALVRPRVLSNQHLDELLFLGSGQIGSQMAKIRGILQCKTYFYWFLLP